MGEDTKQIEQDIRDSRAALSRDLDRLSDKAKDLVSWRSQYENNSRLFLGAAFGAGLALGLSALRSRQNGFSEGEVDVPELDLIGAETYAVGSPAFIGPANGNGTNGTLARARHELGETWAAIADGLVRTASAKAVQFLSENVPGFRDQVEGRYAQQTRAWDENGAD